MQFSKFVKVAAIALPLIAVTACSSHKTTTTGGSASDSTLTQSEREVLQQLQQTNTVYFDFDQYNIKADFAKMLDAHAEFLRAHSFLKVVLEGHADERGTPEYNIALGERRASAVKSYLQGKGVSADQMSIVSYGKEKPAVLGHDAAAYSKNRRAVIVY